jgi:Poly-beta-hydroxybutyrate polymerase (PhaC) N-terminus
MARIAVGSSEVQPSRRDRRFTDPGWMGNPLLRRVVQAYLAAAQTAEGVVADADLNWADAERVGFGSGQQVFMMSWRNPDARRAKWGFDTYGQAILDAMDAVTRIARSEQVALMGTCSGGIIAAMVAAHLAHTGRLDQIAALTLMVTVLDEGGPAWAPP